MKANLDALTPDRLAALREFQEIYGDEWVDRMVDFHMGRPHYKAEHLLPLIRQIRNHVSSNPLDLPGRPIT